MLEFAPKMPVKSALVPMGAESVRRCPSVPPRCEGAHFGAGLKSPCQPAVQRAGDRRRAAAAGAQRRERRRVLAARPATLRGSRARAHRVYARELGRAWVVAGEVAAEARREAMKERGIGR